MCSSLSINCFLSTKGSRTNNLVDIIPNHFTSLAFAVFLKLVICIYLFFKFLTIQQLLLAIIDCRFTSYSRTFTRKGSRTSSISNSHNIPSIFKMSHFEMVITRFCFLGMRTATLAGSYNILLRSTVIQSLNLHIFTLYIFILITWFRHIFPIHR